MSEKRRDHRGRILHVGESQRPDGRYAYKYKDLNGDIKFVYSWRLDKNDRPPAGRARDLSLREKERQIQQDLFNKVVPNGGDLTVLELVQRYLGLKKGVRHNTQANYNFVVNILKKEAFGQKRNDKVKTYDAKAWLIKMQEDGRGYSTIHIYKVQMPKITPHVCRHTFCSNMAKSGMNPKTLQYIMGHSDIGVTLNTYTHIGYEDAQNEMLEIGSLPQENVRLPRPKRVS